jgi:hypothetical protein
MEPWLSGNRRPISNTLRQILTRPATLETSTPVLPASVRTTDSPPSNIRYLLTPDEDPDLVD